MNHENEYQFRDSVQIDRQQCCVHLQNFRFIHLDYEGIYFVVFYFLWVLEVFLVLKRTRTVEFRDNFFEKTNQFNEFKLNQILSERKLIVMDPIESPMLWKLFQLALQRVVRQTISIEMSIESARFTRHVI